VPGERVSGLYVERSRLKRNLSLVFGADPLCEQSGVLFESVIPESQHDNVALQQHLGFTSGSGFDVPVSPKSLPDSSDARLKLIFDPILK
jgi:hypothetical protein